MAGNYPDVPGPRMALDLDGTQVYTIVNGVVTQATAAQVAQLTSETAGNGFGVGTSTTNGAVLFMFPEKRDVVGYYADIDSGNWGLAGPPSVQTSVDTTNGVDGTWTAQAALVTTDKPTPPKPSYRTAIQTVAWNGIRAIKLTRSTGGLDDMIFDAFHLYGVRTAGENPDRLVMWHPTLDQRLGGADLDWGNAPRSSSADKTFRVKNLSATKTATTITLSLSALTETTPTVVGQHLLSADGTAFASTASIASLAPGAISNVLTVRRNTPNNASLSLWSLRIKAAATTWS
jgi:hypothetical protein